MIWRCIIPSLCLHRCNLLHPASDKKNPGVSRTRQERRAYSALDTIRNFIVATRLRIMQRSIHETAYGYVQRLKVRNRRQSVSSVSEPGLALVKAQLFRPRPAPCIQLKRSLRRSIHHHYRPPWHCSACSNRGTSPCSSRSVLALGLSEPLSLPSAV